MSARSTTRSRTGFAAASVLAAGALLLAPVSASATAQACNGWAHNTGLHTTCAASLTLHAAEGDYTLGNGTTYNIEHFADSGNHVWGTGNGHYGWVYNGYFN